MPPTPDSYTLTLSDPRWALELRASTVMESLNPHVVQLLENAKALDEVVDVASIVVTAEPKNAFKYEWKTRDGRTWRQTLYVADGREPTMTFDVKDQFQPHELAPQHELRDHIVELLHRHSVKQISIIKQGAAS